jgi:hypothetical protein
MRKDIRTIKYNKLKLILKKLIKKRKIFRVMVNECVKLLSYYRKKYFDEFGLTTECLTN